MFLSNRLHFHGRDPYDSSMALKNTIIPNEQLSTRERIERKIQGFEGRPFTLADINKLFRPRLRVEAIRFHVENLVNNLQVEKLPREGREKQLYVARDVLKGIEQDTPLNGAAHEYLRELRSIAYHLRQGDVIPEARLGRMREELGQIAAAMESELDDILKIHDCTDLWTTGTLVKRIGFIED